MEDLFAYSYLWGFGFCSKQEYNEYLDSCFLKKPDDELLLELEEYSGSSQETFFRLKRYFEYEKSDFDSKLFGKVLFSGLENAYKSNIFDINEFGERCYELWKLLPESVDMNEPFHTLNYADDCLVYGDEKQTRKLYEIAFDFYK